MASPFVHASAAVPSRPVGQSLLQIVPSTACLHCDICCRFPEADSFLRPFFTADEIRSAVRAGVASEMFPDAEGTQIELVPNPSGEGCLCPAFDPATSQCRMYDVRPLDCRLYPFALMWDASHTEVLLGWDTKCPYMRDLSSAPIEQAAEGTARWIEEDATLEILARYPRLIGRFQDDVMVLRPLTRVTERLRQGRLPVRMQPLTIADRRRLESALAESSGVQPLPLAAASFVFHYIWRHRLTYAWADLHGHLCLFADSPDGIFMVLPPLGTGPLVEPVAAAFRVMRERNGASSVTRIDNVPEASVAELRAGGYVVTAREPDYLYAAADLVELAGDAYRSPRAACNRFVREHGGVCEPYDLRDRPACLSLFREWSEQKERAGKDDWAKVLLEDAAGAHEAALSAYDELGLTGAVVRVQGRIRAYTMGVWLNQSVFCVLLEVADRDMVGAGAFIFREFCRQARDKGACWINTMDDSGLPSLARAKHWYRPARLLANYTVTEPRR
ncbi:MAG: phosphatidylglycerol lysyltransferase domain-containing protein [Nitrospira sp.]|nr:phosphatidylglycerol lysyltransferase domain-containing protein [Nitrospira sp.]MDR4477742.1 phosphatidylglycerol lysyltransferase domain-containing protein [Nitrospira sp.]